MFHEVHVARLHSATTCYTCVPSSGNDRNHESSVATETHALHLSCHSDVTTKDKAQDHNDDHYRDKAGIKLDTDSIPRPKDVSQDAICVGYSMLVVPTTTTPTTTTLPEEEEGDDSPRTNSEKWEAFVLLAPSVPTAASAPAPNHSMADDTTTVVTTTDHNTASGGGGRQQRSSVMSVDAASMIHNSVASIAVTTEPYNISDHHHPTHQQSWIVLKQTTTARRKESVLYMSSIPFRPLSPHLTSLPILLNVNSSNQVGLWVGSADDALLRLYVPHKNNDHTNNTVRQLDVVVEISNDDDDPVNSTNVPPSQREPILDVSLEDDGEQNSSSKFLSFASPVMAIDSLLSTIRCGDGAEPQNKDNEEKPPPNSKSSYYHLALACQDGTVRVVTFPTTAAVVDPQGGQHETNKLVVRRATANTVIVDGPIVTISITSMMKHPPYESSQVVQVVVGSLCGFVCCLLQTHKTSAPPVSSDHGRGQGVVHRLCWNEPSMVVEGLWDNRLHTEDSVLAVHTWNNMIAVGTYSGSCTVWKKLSFSSSSSREEGDSSDEGENVNPKSNREDGYELVWQCQLPFSIHGIWYCEKSTLLLVTTKHTLHVFRGIAPSEDSPNTIKLKKYSADRAKTRLDALWQERRRKDKETVVQTETPRKEEEEETKCPTTT